MKKTIVQIFFLLLLLVAIPLLILVAIMVFIMKKFFHQERITITGEVDYVFKEDTTVTITTEVIKNYQFKSSEINWFSIVQTAAGQTEISINGNKAHAYAWDGCSPKFMLFDLIIGTPDGIIDLGTGKAITYQASMVHDLLYQFRKSFKGNITRKHADDVFLEQLRKAKFQLAEVYYTAVRLFGWTYWNS